MADRILVYGQSGDVLYDDTTLGWYTGLGYPLLPLRGALCSQAYILDDPVHELEVANKKYVDAVLAGNYFELNATPDIQPKAKVGGYYNIVPRVTLSGTLGTTLLAWLEAHVGEIQLVPKVSSSGPEGTMFYDSDDNSVYVGVE